MFKPVESWLTLPHTTSRPSAVFHIQQNPLAGGDAVARMVRRSLIPGLVPHFLSPLMVFLTCRPLFRSFVPFASACTPSPPLPMITTYYLPGSISHLSDVLVRLEFCQGVCS